MHSDRHIRPVTSRAYRSSGMLIASVYPLVMTISDSANSPFLSTGAYLTANILVQIPIGWFLSKKTDIKLDIRNVASGGSKGWRKHWPMMLIPLTVLFFALSVRWLESSVVAAMIAESWPLLFAPAVVYLTGKEGWEWESTTLRRWRGMIIGCLGMAVVLSSQGLTASGGAKAAIFGGIAALVAACCTSCMSFGHRWAEDICSSSLGESPKSRALQHAQAMCYRASCLFWYVPLMIVIGVAAGESSKIDIGNVVVLFFGGAIVACARPLMALSVAMENNLGGFSLLFAQPVLSLVWLVLAGEIGNVHWRLIVAGGILMLFGVKTAIAATKHSK